MKILSRTLSRAAIRGSGFLIPSCVGFMPHRKVRDFFKLARGLSLLLCSLFLLFSFFVSASVYGAYTKESEVEVLTPAGSSQSSNIYRVESALGQPTPVATLSSGCMEGSLRRVYPGYLSNLNSRIIKRYGLSVGDIDADIDTDEETQMAGVYFPLSIIAYDGYEQVAKSDSGTSLTLTTASTTLRFDGNGDGTFSDSTLALSKGQWPANESLAPQDEFADGFRAYDTIVGSNIWIKAQDGRSKEASIANLNIQPAWVNTYTVTASSPQNTDNRWSERIYAWDVYGNLANSWENLNGHFSPEITVSLDPLFKTARQDIVPSPFYLYTGITSQDGTEERTYSLSSEGKASIYMIDEVGGNLQLKLVGNVYDYSSLAQSVSASSSQTVTSGNISIFPSQWTIEAQFFYDYANSSFQTSGWLEKDGQLITDSLQGADLYIYDEEGEVLSNLEGSLDNQSVYQFLWSEANLTEPVYFVKIVITRNGRVHTSNFSFNTDFAPKLANLVREELSGEIPVVEAALKGIEDGTVEKIKSTYTSGIQADVAKILVSAERTLPAYLHTARDELIGNLQAHIFNTPTSMRQGEEYLISFQTYSGTSPTLDVYDPDGEVVVSKKAMEELESSGVYQVKFDLEESWQRGTYTLICSEATYGTLDAVSVLILMSDLDKVGQSASAVVGTTSSIQQYSGLNEEIEGVFDIIMVEMEEMIEKSVKTSKELALTAIETDGSEEIKEATGRLYDNLLKIRNKMKDGGLVVSSLIDNIADFDASRKFDLDYIKKKFIQVEVVFRLHRQIVANLVDRPVIQTWYEFR